MDELVSTKDLSVGDRVVFYGEPATVTHKLERRMSGYQFSLDFQLDTGEKRHEYVFPADRYWVKRG